MKCLHYLEVRELRKSKRKLACFPEMEQRRRSQNDCFEETNNQTNYSDYGERELDRQISRGGHALFRVGVVIQC